MTAKKDFKVISKAAYIAGQRNPGEGETISLSAEQARYPLILGEIDPLSADTNSPPKPETKSVSKKQELDTKKTGKTNSGSGTKGDS